MNYPKTSPESAKLYNRAKAVMVQIHDLLVTYPGLSGYMGSHIGDFGSEPLAKLVLEPLRTAGLSDANARKVTLALVVFTSGHLLLREGLPDLNGSNQRELFEDGLDLILDGARGRVRKPATRSRALPHG